MYIIKITLMVCLLSIGTLLSGQSCCAVSSCFTDNANIGLVNQVNSNFLSLGHGFSAIDGNDLGYDHDRFQTTTISWQSWLGNWAIYADQGYAWKYRHEDGTTQGHQGLTNARVTVFYKLVNQSFESSNLILRMGLNAKLPTGHFVENTHENYLPESFSPSDGSWGMGASTDVIWKRDRDGFVYNFGFSRSFEDPNGLRPGNTIDNQITYFRIFEKTHLSLMPFVGLVSEIVKNSIYPSGREADLTGRQAMLASAGVSLDFGRFNFGLNAMIPLLSELGDANAKAAPRFQFQSTYLFN